MDPVAKTRIRELEEALSKAQNEVVQLNNRLNAQSVELALQGHVGNAVADDMRREMSAYESINTDLIAFVQKVADSMSKFSKEAKKLLGQ